MSYGEKLLPARGMLAIWLMVSLVSCAGTQGGSGFWEQGHPRVLRHTLKELRDQNVVKQREDYSCGSAALATLIRYYFGDETSEKEILEFIQGPLNEEEKKQKALRGFSLLDLKQAAQHKGYRAAGFKLTLAQLLQVTAPVIVFLEPMGYKHFAVYRGMDRGRIYLADPARGNMRMSIDRFLHDWHGIVFVLGKAGPGEEQIKDYPLAVPNPTYVQFELARFNGVIDLGMMLQTLPLSVQPLVIR
jgi:predicted double-glycine peptidase